MTKEREEELVELLITSALRLNGGVRTVVLHKWPDDDAWLCLWLATKYMKLPANVAVVFVPAGTALEGTEGDPSVVHFDTGNSEFDQHGKQLERSCSAVLLAKSLGVQNHPGLQDLLEMVTAVDNAELVSRTSLHFAIEGYPYLFKGTDGLTDWATVQQRVFELFDIVFKQATRRAAAMAQFKRLGGSIRTLPNGIRLATLPGTPNLRDSAFENGADVVVWTESRPDNTSWVGIQVNRQSKISLSPVAAWLRFCEANLRDIDVAGKNLCYVGQGVVPSWFLHDSERLVLCGSRSHPLEGDLCTRMTPLQVIESVAYILSSMPV